MVFYIHEMLSLKVLESGLLLELGIIILLATILGLIASYLKQPMIPVYILVGLLINYLSSHNLAFNKESILSISELGIALLLFLIGMEFDIDKIKNILSFSIIGTLIQVSTTSLLTLALLYMFSIPFKKALLIAIALSFSSTAIVIKYLSDKGTIDTIYGRNALGILLMQDILVILIIPFLMSAEKTSLEYHILDIILKGSGLIALALASNRFIIKPLMKYFYNNVDITFLLSLSVLFIFSIISSVFGFSIAIGGFIGGLAAAVYPYSYRVTQRIAHLRDFFIVLFFVALGLQMSLASLSSQYLILTSLLVIFTLLIKPMLYLIPSLLFGNDAKNSLQLGITLAQTSEFSLILGGIALNSGILTKELLSIIGGVFFITSFLSSYMIQWNWVITSKLYRYFEFLEKINIANKAEEESLDAITSNKMRDHIIIYGINAFTKILLEKLNPEKIVVLSDDIQQVRLLRREGYNVIFGSIDDEEILKDIYIDKAQIFIYAKEDFNELSESLATVKSLNKHIKIIGRSNSFKKALKLYEGGADFILIDGRHNYEDLKKVVELILNHENEQFQHLKDREIEYLTKEIEKEVLALHLPEELQQIKNIVTKKS